MNNFIKTSVFGGIVFLVPFVVVFVVIGKALSTIHAFVAPLLTQLEVDNIFAAAVIHLLPLTLLVLLCFLAGLAANTPVVGRMVKSFDDVLRANIPGYGLLRAKMDSMFDPEDAERLNPVLVRFDDSWQLGFETDLVTDGKRAIFLPGAPDPWSGSVCVVEASRVKPLDASVKSVNVVMKRLGKGTADIVEIPDSSSSAA